MKFRQYCMGALSALSLLVLSCYAKDESWKDKFPSGFKAEGSLVKDESDRPYYADYFGRRLKEMTYPRVALAEADKFYDSVPFEKRPPHRDKVRVDFIHSYFSGFTNPAGSMTGGRLGNIEGFQAGQAYRRENPEKLSDIMKGFGYIPIEIEGTWTSSFEHSGFKPKNNKNGEEWWLGGAGQTESDLPKDYQLPDDGVVITVTGFLSAEGQYGHLGSYKRELLAKKITLKKPVAQAPR